MFSTIQPSSLNNSPKSKKLHFSSEIHYYSKSPFLYPNSEFDVGIQNTSNGPILGMIGVALLFLGGMAIFAAKQSAVTPTVRGSKAQTSSSSSGSSSSLSSSIPSTPSGSLTTNQQPVPPAGLDKVDMKFTIEFLHKGAKNQAEYDAWVDKIKLASSQQKNDILNEIFNTSYIQKTKDWRVLSLFADTADNLHKKKITSQIIDMHNKSYFDYFKSPHYQEYLKIHRKRTMPTEILIPFQKCAADMLNTMIFPLFLEKGLSPNDFNEKEKRDFRLFMTRFSYLAGNHSLIYKPIFGALLSNLATEQDHVRNMNWELDIVNSLKPGVPEYGTVSFPPEPPVAQKPLHKRLLARLIK